MIQRQETHSDSVEWRFVLSFEKADLERSGYFSPAALQQLLAAKMPEIAKLYHISPEHMVWNAAFHPVDKKGREHHPHVHIYLYSTDPAEGVQSQKQTLYALEKSRSVFTNEVFSQEVSEIQALGREARKELCKASEQAGKEPDWAIRCGLTEDIEKLRDSLPAKGRKYYKYLPRSVKQQVDNIVKKLVEQPAVQQAYRKLEEAQRQYVLLYNDEPEKIAARMESWKTHFFHPTGENDKATLHNAVLRLAESWEAEPDKNGMLSSEQISADEEKTIEPQAAEPSSAEPTEPDTGYTHHSYGSRRQKKPTWWTEAYKKARNYLYGTKNTPPDFEAALTLMQAEADKGNGFAMHDLGKMHLSGLGCDKDEEQAQEWFAKAYHAFIAQEARTEKKDYLQYRIGKLFSFGYGVEQDYRQAAEWYEKAVEENNPFAAYALGSLCRRGQGVEQDDIKAFELYTMAAEQEEKPNAYAAYELGRMCRDGIGTEKDSAASDAWYKQAYEGFLVIEQNMADDKLYYRLGQMNLTGTGTEINLPLAKIYFEKAAKLENPDALYGLGKLYLQKASVYYEPQQAVSCLLEAAKKEHEYAQYMLGRLFLRGDEVLKDVDHALYWLEEAVKKENAQAEYLLGKTLLEGRVLPQNVPKALELLNRAAGQNARQAQMKLAEFFIDRQAALHWLSGTTLPTEIGLQYYDANGFPPESARWRLERYDSFLKHISVPDEYVAAVRAGAGLLLDKYAYLQNVSAAVQEVRRACRSAPGIWTLSSRCPLYQAARELTAEQKQAVNDLLPVAAQSADGYAAEKMQQAVLDAAGALRFRELARQMPVISEMTAELRKYIRRYPAASRQSLPPEVGECLSRTAQKVAALHPEFQKTQTDKPAYWEDLIWNEAVRQNARQEKIDHCMKGCVISLVQMYGELLMMSDEQKARAQSEQERNKRKNKGRTGQKEQKKEEQRKPEIEPDMG